ncbi:MAG: hypothetical protein VKJ24_04995, partial [Synechococcales bacterium]|nr:hypothetical protein [Synechococcales bacterium]
MGTRQTAIALLLTLLSTGSGTLGLPRVSLAEVDRKPAATSVAFQSVLAQAKQHYHQAEFQPAIALYQQILAAPQATATAKTEALLQLATIESWMDQKETIVPKLEQALKLARQSGDRRWEARALAALAHNQQQDMKAVELLQEVLELRQATNQKT